MIKKVEIENYKSLENLSLELGRFNVLIGENGCGKTNILESLIFAASGLKGTVENNFLALKGGRTSEAKFFRSGFDEQKNGDPIKINLIDHKEGKIELALSNDNQPFSKWIPTSYLNSLPLMEENTKILDLPHFKEYFEIDTKNNEIKFKKRSENVEEEKTLKQAFKVINKYLKFKSEIDLIKFALQTDSFAISDYLVYAPENFFLRNININETFIEPIGYRGEGLLKLVKIIKKEKAEQYQEIIQHLHLLDWFDNFDVAESDFGDETEFKLSDKYLEEGLKSFDIRNANEGFLFVLFYLTIFISDYTPKVFAIDNIDTALNPKLCSKLISVLTELAKKHDKQVIISTHNPSILDGLNLNDDDQRLFVVERNKSGRTRATRIEKKPTVNGTAPVKLSEQFLRGYIGGLPKNF